MMSSRYEVVVDEADGRINYHLIESESKNLIVLVEFAWIEFAY